MRAIEQFAELAESFEPSAYSAVAPAADAAEAAPDFSELLGSLDYDESAPEAPWPRPPIRPTRPCPMSRSTSTRTCCARSRLRPRPGASSRRTRSSTTSAATWTSRAGLTDELSALTGLGRPGRPTASVNKIPEPAAAGDVLRRDTRVDKDTLLKIIDGIKNL